MEASFHYCINYPNCTEELPDDSAMDTCTTCAMQEMLDTAEERVMRFPNGSTISFENNAVTISSIYPDGGWSNI